MAAIAATPAGATRRARNWFAWPLAWRAVSVVAFVAIVFAGAWYWPAATGVLDGIWQGPIDHATAVIAALGRQAAPIVGAGSVAWHAIEPLALGFVVLIAVMGTACATFGAVLRHVAWERTSS